MAARTATGTRRRAWSSGSKRPAPMMTAVSRNGRGSGRTMTASAAVMGVMMAATASIDRIVSSRHVGKILPERFSALMTTRPGMLIPGHSNAEPTTRAGIEVYDALAPMRVLLADDHTLVRAGIRGLVAAIPGVEIVAEAADGQ